MLYRSGLVAVLGLGLWMFSAALWAQAGTSPVTQHQLQTLEFRLERVERMLDARVLTEMLQNLDQMQGEMRRLRGQVEQLENDLRTVRNRQTSQVRALEERLAQLESGAITRDEVIAELTPPSSAVDADVQPLPGADEQTAYQEAFERLMNGEYEQAMLSLERFLERYPAGVYAPNALYWLAEAKYAMRDFAGALLDFSAVRERFPDSDKSGDALLKMGYAHFELGRYAEAREALNRVVAEHSGTTLSRLAQDRLRRMEELP